MSSQTELIQKYFEQIACYRKESLYFFQNEDLLNKIQSIDAQLIKLDKNSSDIKNLLAIHVPSLYLLEGLFFCIKSDIKKIVSILWLAKNFAIIQSRKLELLLIVIPLILVIIIVILAIKSNLSILFFLFIFYLIFRINTSSDNYYKKLKYNFSDCEKEINNLKKQRQELIKSSQEIALDNLQNLEHQLQKMLDENEKKLVERGLKKLKLGQGQDENLELDPITSFNGIKDNDQLKSSILKHNSHEYLDSINKELLIRPEDFYYENGLDRKERFGVYEFCSIFITHNLLAYYRCYWNFVRQSPVDEETCVYLYDTIVSVHTYERSSLNQKDSSIIRNYGGYLTINTTDGKKITMKISDDKKRKIDLEKYFSESTIDQVAEGIRQWLKQKRVDIHVTKSID